MSSAADERAAALSDLLSEALRAVGSLRAEAQVLEEAAAVALAALDQVLPFLRNHHLRYSRTAGAARRLLIEALEYRRELQVKREMAGTAAHEAARAYDPNE